MARQESGEPYYRVDSDEAAGMFGDNDVVFVDVRRPDEYVEGHIKGAIFIPVDDLLARMEEVPKDKKLLFICAAGVRSGLACEMAAAMGYNTDFLYNIEDGTPSWIEKGHPTSYGADE